MAITPGHTSEASPGFVTDTVSWSHDNDGDILWVATLQNIGAVAPVLTATYNGLAMTEANHRDIGDNHTVWLFYFLAPATGAHTVIVTSDQVKTDLLGAAASYSGALQSSVPEATNTNTAVDTTLTTTVTTTHDDCWVILATSSSGGVGNADLTPSTNLIVRGARTTGLSGSPPSLRIMDSGAQIGAQGYAMTYLASALSFMIAVGASFQPTTETGTPFGAYLLLQPRSRLREW